MFQKNAHKITLKTEIFVFKIHVQYQQITILINMKKMLRTVYLNAIMFGIYSMFQPNNKLIFVIVKMNKDNVHLISQREMNTNLLIA